MPVWDPNAKGRREERGQQLSHHVRLTKIEFGVCVGEGRDGFSVEWSTRVGVVAFVFFDDKERMIVVEIGDHTTIKKVRWRNEANAERLIRFFLSNESSSICQI